MKKNLSLQAKNKIARESDANIDKLQRLASISYLYLGAELKRIKEEKLYSYLGESPEYESFDAYVSSKNIEMRKAYYLMQIHEVFILKYGFKPEELFEIPWTSLRCLLPITRPENVKELVEKARNLSRTHLEMEVKALKSGMTGLSECKHPEITEVHYFRCKVCGEHFREAPKESKVVK